MHMMVDGCTAGVPGSIVNCMAMRHLCVVSVRQCGCVNADGDASV